MKKIFSSKRKITFGNTDVAVSSERVKKILSDPRSAADLAKAIREQRDGKEEASFKTAILKP
jgi:hypothetical protein